MAEQNDSTHYLTHEVWYDPVEDGVPQPEASLSSAESPEVLCSLGNNIGEQLDGDGAQALAVSSNCEEHLRVRLFGVLLDSGHLRRDACTVLSGLAHVALTFAEDFLEGFGDLWSFEPSCQLLHDPVTIWGGQGLLNPILNLQAEQREAQICT